MSDIRREVEGLASRLRILQRVANPSPEMVDLIDHLNTKLGELLTEHPDFNDFDLHVYGYEPSDNGDREDDI